MDSRHGCLDQLRDGRSSAQVINNGIGYGLHASQYAIIGSSSQAQTSDIRDCDIRRAVRNPRMGEIKTTQPEAIEILSRLETLDLTQRELAGALDLSENKVSKIRAGERQMKAGEVDKAREWLDEVERRGGFVEKPDIPEASPGRDYLPVEILPSYAGMGGGGTGEGDIEHALLPRRLIEDELHAQPADLLMIEARGGSMEPDFQHGDQILIDKRDRNPVQPGAFALWDGDGYVVKFVERVPRQAGRYRIFSADTRLSSFEVEADEITIMGRPVWFGRRL
jgi:phage repressor protein C with HTH and peptisase S24 domain